MVNGVTCLLLLAAIFAQRGTSLPVRDIMGLFEAKTIDRLKEIIGEIQLESMQIKELLEHLRQLESADENPILSEEQYGRLHEAEYGHLPNFRPSPDRDLSSEEIVDPVDPKRGGYMSLCHFKICNMGRKRSAGGPAPLLKSP